LYNKILNDVYPIFKKNPFFGIKIKKLKGKYIYRFKIGDYRLFYKVDELEKIVFIINVENRQDAYK